VTVGVTTVVTTFYKYAMPIMWTGNGVVFTLYMVYGHYLLINIVFHYYMGVFTNPGNPPKVSLMHVEFVVINNDSWNTLIEHSLFLRLLDLILTTANYKEVGKYVINVSITWSVGYVNILFFQVNNQSHLVPTTVEYAISKLWSAHYFVVTMSSRSQHS